MKTETNHRTVVYKQDCPNCKHKELTRIDTELVVWNPMHVPYGLNSEVIHREPPRPEVIGQPQEFWTSVHCESCKRSFHHSILVHEHSRILRDSEHEQYLRCMERRRHA